MELLFDKEVVLHNLIEANSNIASAMSLINDGVTDKSDRKLLKDIILTAIEELLDSRNFI